MSTGSFRTAIACAISLLASAAVPAVAAPITTTVQGIGDANFGPRAGSTVIDFNSGLPSDPNFSGSGSLYGLHTGSQSGVAATPFGDATQYYSTGVGTTTVTFDETATYLGLLWGSVDGYNSIEFYDGNTLVGTIGGSDIRNPANGDQGIGGTFYVNFDVAGGFNRIKLRSSGYSFEIDDLAYGAHYDRIAEVPEPTSVLLLGAGLFALGCARRRRA